ncbi:alpha/beta hydrolase [Dyella dinghuensis]|uniref:Alpha/beta hydrolase n=1 Tax=Dyella dinghuensis TaxID=1920169 RepID=A0A3S0PXS5_9GAMM|nr:alpha/beta hydrolase [Dyella dinghuensis]RUL63198.1 alpha/beta hydrolase [Dyella dinghuensis]
MKRVGLTVFACSMLAVLGSLGVSAQTAPQQPTLFARRLVSLQPAIPSGTRVIDNVSYGSDPRQRFDVYAPAEAAHAPVIFMVHGGAWAFGDKSARGVVENKAARWVPRGFIFISVDYRMLPDASPLTQANDVARALAYAQQHAREWGGDPSQFIVMGHSAGAHLVSLITADTAIAQQNGAAPWLGTVSLDSAALDVVQTMQGRHLPLYSRAFGSDPSGWVAVSPLQQLHGRIVPFLAVCSTRRQDSCPQAQNFVAKSGAFGSQAKVLPEDLTHEQINEQLGTASDYTDNVEAFMRGLSPAVASALSQK